MDNNQITALGKLQAEDRQVNNAKISQNLANCDNRFDNILKDSSNSRTTSHDLSKATTAMRKETNQRKMKNITAQEETEGNSLSENRDVFEAVYGK